MIFDNPKQKMQYDSRNQSFWHYIHIDGPLFSLLILLATAGLFVLYSATGQDDRSFEFQAMRFVFAFFTMFIFAQIPPITLKRSAPWVYGIGMILLIAVLFIGNTRKGGQRWLNLGLFHMQPTEIMKLAIPLLLASYYHNLILPIKLKSVLIALPIILIPAFLTARQPDLSTAVLLVVAGASVLFFAGLSGRIITVCTAMVAILIPLTWYVLHDYQKQRVLTFLNPEQDPLGKGYHIIQSKIAIGSGGIFGKGWLNGTQSNLEFLPEHSTDFIFAVLSEEFGFVGTTLLIFLYLAIVFRGLYITVNAQDTFTRLLAGSITFTFFVSFFLNMGMVTGLIPVAGIPLPLVSYGGSSMVTLLASFGILMSIQTHRKLVTT